MERYEYNIVVAGDPIQDYYVFGEVSDTKPPRFGYTDHRLIMGGAANVEANLKKLVPKTVRIASIFDRYELANPYRLTRYVNSETHETFLEIPSRGISEWHYEPMDIDWELALSSTGSSSRFGLVISDYNKGTVNRILTPEELEAVQRQRWFEFLIVDSRYGTYNRELLEYGRMKILHVTGAAEWEHHKQDLTLFTYVIYTNGEGEVKVYKPEGKPINNFNGLIKCLPVPWAEVVDTTGAGDTFVASLAAYLATHANVAWTDELIIEASKTAIANCQIVIQKFGAATI